MFASKKTIFFSVLSVILSALTLLVMCPGWKTHTIFYYMTSVVFLPAAYILISSLLSGLMAKDDLPRLLAVHIGAAVVISLVISLGTHFLLTEETLNTIISNTESLETAGELNVSKGGAGDIIQAVVCFIALGGLGSLIGYKIGKKRRMAPKAY